MIEPQSMQDGASAWLTKLEPEPSADVPPPELPPHDRSAGVAGSERGPRPPRPACSSIGRHLALRKRLPRKRNT